MTGFAGSVGIMRCIRFQAMQQLLLTRGSVVKTRLWSLEMSQGDIPRDEKRVSETSAF